MVPPKAEFDDAVYDMAKIYGSAVVPSFMDRNKLIKLEPKVRAYCKQYVHCGITFNF